MQITGRLDMGMNAFARMREITFPEGHSDLSPDPPQHDITECTPHVPFPGFNPVTLRHQSFQRPSQWSSYGLRNKPKTMYIPVGAFYLEQQHRDSNITFLPGSP